jgi:twinkle protein
MPKTAVPRPSFAIDLSVGLTEEAKEYLSIRGLKEKVCYEARLFSCRRSFRGGEQPAIGFPNIINGKVVGVKYRGLNKEFSQEAGSEQALWGQDKIIAPILVITEGEIDAISARQSGFESAVSVPGGAPLRVSDGKISPSEDRKFSFIWEGKSFLDKMEKIILAVDNDEPGQALQEELARRIGKARCWTVTYPDGCKDLNDVLVRHGEDDVRRVIDEARPFPINGLFDASTYFDAIEDKYVNGNGKGVSTGYTSVDELYTIVPGQLSVVTGWPSSGKSNFVDQLCVNLAREKDWRFMMASFENPPEDHIIKLAEIFLKKPFYPGLTQRMTQDELKLAKEWVRDHFLFLDVANGGTSLESILQRAQAAVARIGIRGMVIDPYNYIELPRTGTETESINHMLTTVNAFAKANEVHTWFVAHPAKIQREGADLPIPDGMAISGSMSWWAKADVGLTVHRQTDEVLIKVWKCRWRWVGKLGRALLNYDLPSGTYSAPPF